MSELSGNTPGDMLPWGVAPRRAEVRFKGTPGDFIINTMFGEFCTLAKVKIKTILALMVGSPNKEMAKPFRKGTDQQFDLLLSSMSVVADKCMPILLAALLTWRKDVHDDMQLVLEAHKVHQDALSKMAVKDAIHLLSEIKSMALHFIFCRTLVEVIDGKTKVCHGDGEGRMVCVRVCLGGEGS